MNFLPFFVYCQAERNLYRLAAFLVTSVQETDYAQVRGTATTAAVATATAVDMATLLATTHATALATAVDMATPLATALATTTNATPLATALATTTNATALATVLATTTNATALATTLATATNATALATVLATTINATALATTLATANATVLGTRTINPLVAGPRDERVHLEREVDVHELSAVHHDDADPHRIRTRLAIHGLAQDTGQCCQKSPSQICHIGI